LIEKEFAPIAENEEFTDRLSESMVVRIPTRAMIPNAMIKTVRMVLNRFDRIDIKEIRKFSLVRAIFRKYWLVCFTIVYFGTAKLRKPNHIRNFLVTFNSEQPDMDLQKRISAFAQLGKILPGLIDDELLKKVLKSNNWFTASEVARTMNSWASVLTFENLNRWIEPYRVADECEIRNILVITAGNIPLVGFHDFLSVLITGNRFIGKLSSRDNILLTLLARELIRIEPLFANYLEIDQPLPVNNGLQSGKVKPDAVIATGSDNSARYFQTEFGNIPHIIRKNRSSAAILDGAETDPELKDLAGDILEYYGLGCRSVSHLYLPAGYRLAGLAKVLSDFSGIDSCEPLKDNLRYQRARMGMLNIIYIDARQTLLVESELLHSPIGVVHYSFYQDKQKLLENLMVRQDEIQCLVGHQSIYSKLLPFGTVQKPELWDYADEVDTVEFLRRVL
jgi:hypothetical protein